MSLRPTTIERLLHAYQGAGYRWELDGRWRNLRIGKPAPDVDAAFPDAARFGLLSAWNPKSVLRDVRENQVADEALHFWLAESGLQFRPAFASAPDRSWREPSWLVAGLPVEVFDDLARRFDQLGTLWWTREGPVRLRMRASCPDACGDVPFVDWLE